MTLNYHVTAVTNVWNDFELRWAVQTEKNLPFSTCSILSWLQTISKLPVCVRNDFTPLARHLINLLINLNSMHKSFWRLKWRESIRIKNVLANNDDKISTSRKRRGESSVYQSWKAQDYLKLGYGDVAPTAMTLSYNLMDSLRWYHIDQTAQSAMTKN